MMYMHTTTITVKKITSLFKQETVGQHLIGVHEIFLENFHTQKFPDLRYTYKLPYLHALGDCLFIEVIHYSITQGTKSHSMLTTLMKESTQRMGRLSASSRGIIQLSHIGNVLRNI